MRKSTTRVLLLGAIVCAVLAATGCTSEKGPYKDGVYFAQDKDFASEGWKNQVTVYVKDGNISAVDWDCAGNAGLASKKLLKTEYGMKPASSIGKEWDEQAAAIEAYIVETQNVEPAADAVSGCTIDISGFKSLMKEALASQPVEKGLYAKDGNYFAQSETESFGYLDNVLVTVANGRVVAVFCNAYDPKGGPSKYLAALQGKYVMNAPQGEWNVQAQRTADLIVKDQGAVRQQFKDGKLTDANSGVSITVESYFKLANKALDGAKK